jgi:hypothetical protein
MIPQSLLFDLTNKYWLDYNDWNRNCERCGVKHERASAYILHSCGKEGRPNSKGIHSRQRHVDDERSKAASPGLDSLSMQEYSHTLWQESYL